MTKRGQQLHATADEQIAQLIGLVSTLDGAALRRPCPGRDRLGDGTVAASLRHTADNYQRIAVFSQSSDRMTAGHKTQHNGHRIPRFLREGSYSADNVDLDAVVKQLAASRDTLSQISALTDSQLDAIPPKDSFRFCDGQRTLQHVLASLLKHQGHQVDALITALA